MGSKAQEIEKLVAPVVAELGYRLIEVLYQKVGPDWILRLYIDHPDGVSLDDCELVSNKVSDLLDEVDPIPHSYRLEVSSPGAERPLKTPRDYELFSGRDVVIKTYAPVGGKRRFRGELVGLQDGDVVLTENGARVRIPRDSVASARLALKW